MKKLVHILALLPLILVWNSCDYNELNFPGYGDINRPSNVANYEYTLTEADFVTIGNAVKADVEKQIAEKQVLIKKLQEQLATETDPTVIADLNNQIVAANAEITELKLDENYVSGVFLATNKFFNAQYPAADYAALLLNKKYLYADKGSTVALTYKYKEDADTAAIADKNKYKLTTDDYNALGEGTDQPGQFDNFSSKINPDIYIPRLLQVKYPLAQAGELRMIRYAYYTGSSAITTYTIYKCTGDAWMPYSLSEQFLFSQGEWVFDPTITFEPSKDDYYNLMAFVAENDGERVEFLEGHNGWVANQVVRFVYNPSYPPSGTDYKNVRTEFFFGTSYYYANIDITEVKRSYDTDIELMAYFKQINADETLTPEQKTAKKTAFMEQRVVQGLAILAHVKYPELPAEVKGIPQHVKMKVQVYDGNRYYWIYDYKVVAPGVYEFVERTKWK